MFGIFYLLASLATNCAAEIKHNKFVNDLKRDTYDPKFDTYLSDKGVFVQASTGKAAFHRIEGNRSILVDSHGNVLKDPEREKMLRDYEERRKYNPDENVTVMKYSLFGDPGTINRGLAGMEERENGIKGIRYKDLKTGDIYVKRNFFGATKNILNGHWDIKKMSNGHCIPNVDFYMDIQTGYLVRVADGEWEKKKEFIIKDGFYKRPIEEILAENKEDAEFFIKEFNQEQRENEKKGLKENKPYLYFCNYDTLDIY